VVSRLREMLLEFTRIFADETVVPVLDPGRGRTKQGYFWAIGRDDRPWAGILPARGQAGRREEMTPVLTPHQSEGDAIVPRAQLEYLVAHLGGPARLIDLPSTRGHDAFLTEPRALGLILDNALSIQIHS